MPITAEKIHKMVVPLDLTDAQYGQIFAKADHDNIKPEDVIQEAVELYLHQINGEKIILDVDLMIEAFDIYKELGLTSLQLKTFCEQNKF